MLLTEIIKYSKKELQFIEFWNSCEWVYCEEYPRSIFLIQEGLVGRGGIWYKEKQCVIEISFRDKKIKFNTCASKIYFLLKFELYLEEDEIELYELVENVINDLICEISLNPERNELIKKANFKRSKKIDYRKFKFYPLQFNNRISKLENFINKDIKPLTNKERKKNLGW